MNIQEPQIIQPVAEKKKGEPEIIDLDDLTNPIAAAV